METRLHALDNRRSAIRRDATPEQRQRVYEGIINAIREAFALYASLPRETALRTLPDSQLRELRDEAVMVDGGVKGLGAADHKAKQGKLGKDLDLLKELIKLNATRDVPLSLDLLYARVAQGKAEGIDYWARRADGAVKMLGIVDVTLRLPHLSRQERAMDESRRREYTSRALVSRFGELRIRVGEASDDASLAGLIAVHADHDAEAIGAEDLERQLDAFINDTSVAFKSISDVIDGKEVQSGKPLTKDAVAVLDGVLGRLAGFASFLDDANATLRTAQDPGATRRKHQLDMIVERTWLTANEVTRTLQTFAHEDAVPPPLPDVPAAAAVPTQRRDRHAKGKRKQAAGAPSHSEQAPPAPAPAAATAAAKVLVRSELGTQYLADAGEVAASSSHAALQAWQRPLSRQDLQHRLDRLDEMLAFDLAAQQRAVSQARRVQDPEAARHVSEQAISRLDRQAAEMAACIQALDGNRKLLGLQLPVVHQKLGELKTLQAQAKGQANALRENLDGAQADHLKTYRFPTQEHIKALLGKGQLAKGDLLALRGEPGTLFELQLQPLALRNGKLPKPIWLHIHTREPVHGHDLAMLDDAAFDAAHVKADDQRGRNREWQDAQARAGRDNALIHRGKISPQLCRELVE